MGEQWWREVALFFGMTKQTKQTVSRQARPTAGFDKRNVYGVYAFRGKN